MKLLVTGCAGFIGANFVKYILENHPNDKVIGGDRLTYAANLDALEELKSISFLGWRATASVIPTLSAEQVTTVRR